MEKESFFNLTPFEAISNLKINIILIGYDNIYGNNFNF
jgi:hypothetical protein